MDSKYDTDVSANRPRYNEPIYGTAKADQNVYEVAQSSHLKLTTMLGEKRPVDILAIISLAQ